MNDEQSQFYNIADLTVYINIARNTIATQAECLIANASLSTVGSTQSYAMSALSPPSGLQSAINLRSVRSIVGGIGAILEGRPWQWFLNYYLTGANTTTSGVPTVWSLQNQGSVGNVWFWAIPNGTITMSVEATWTPVALVNDSTAEALGYPWTDAVPYFAAYLALLNAQRTNDAHSMLQLFNAFVKAARIGVTPETNATNWPTLKPLQSAFDPTATNLPNAKPSAGGEGNLG